MVCVGEVKMKDSASFPAGAVTETESRVLILGASLADHLFVDPLFVESLSWNLLAISKQNGCARR